MKKDRFLKEIRKLAGNLIYLIPLLFLLNGFHRLAQGQEIILKKMIGEKEYRIEKIKNEPGNFMVSYGEEKIKWVPKPWHVKELVEQGPAYYDNVWGKGGLNYPFDLSIEERISQLSARDIVERRMDEHLCAYAYDLKQAFAFTSVDTKGYKRTKAAIWWAKMAYKLNKESIPPGVKKLQRSVIVMINPVDTRGIGVLYNNYQSEDKMDEQWLYLPSQRKVRRMTIGNRKDSFFGTVYTNEDFMILNPYFHKYKLLGTALFKDPGPKVYGFNAANPEAEVLRVTRPDGVGAPHWVIEVTPGPKAKDWWFAKEIIHFNMYNFEIGYEESYDEKGKLFRIAHNPAKVMDPEHHPYYTLYSLAPAEDLRSRFKTYFEPELPYFDTGFDDRIFSERTLVREPTDLSYMAR